MTYYSYCKILLIHQVKISLKWLFILTVGDQVAIQCLTIFSFQFQSFQLMFSWLQGKNIVVEGSATAKLLISWHPETKQGKWHHRRRGQGVNTILKSMPPWTSHTYSNVTNLLVISKFNQFDMLWLWNTIQPFLMWQPNVSL